VIDAALDRCGCCGLESGSTACGCSPALGSAVRPGLSALPYRLGTHGSFLEAMKSAIHHQAGLTSLAAREPDDPAIAVLDAWAMVLDVLAFYNERILNEGYLRTATERASVLELAAQIGYQLKPGVAASTFLAFELETAKGAPVSTLIDVGTRAQSLPGPGERPQVFETIAPIHARPELNAMRVRAVDPTRIPMKGDTTIYLSAAAAALKPGDPLLIFYMQPNSTTACDLRYVRSAERLDLGAALTVTAVGLDAEIGGGTGFSEPTGFSPAVFLLRQRASLFGHNAPEWRSMPADFRTEYSGGQPAAKQGFMVRKDDNLILKDKWQMLATASSEWPDFSITALSGDPTIVPLDGLYPKILPESWLVLVDASEGKAFQVKAVSRAGLSRFTLTAQVSLVTLGDTASKFDTQLRDTVAYGESHQLEVAGPIFDAVQGKAVTLSAAIAPLEQGRALAFKGRRAQVVVQADNLVLLRDDGAIILLNRGERLVLDRPYRDVSGNRTWFLRRADGTVGSISPPVTSTALRFVPASEPAETVTEVVALDRLAAYDPLHPTLLLAADLVNSYDRLDLSISANVAPATHGETRHEVLGSGDASQPFQRFTLKQSPLTYVSSPNAKGVDSTLEIRVNGIAWHELPSFYRQGPRARGYVVRIADNRSATVEFGDGATAARLPSGIENVTATYRSGIGREAMVRAGQVSLLQTRPLGVKMVTNPVAASGAGDPEPLSEARRHAPVTVVTFDRVVSLTDFADFASAFPGIGKAHATWLWGDHTALVHVTVAGAGGAAIPPGSELSDNLVAATRRTGIFHQPFMVDAADMITFALTAGIYRDPDYEWPAVRNAARAALLDAFSFDARDFAQPVTESEVLAVLQGVPGVQGIRLVVLGPSGVGGGVAAMVPSLPARVAGTDVLPAQLLTIDPAQITLMEQT
jgi:hypothetical protein